MARRWIIVAICIVVVGAGGFFILKGVRGQARAQQQPPVKAPQKSETEMQRQQLESVVLGIGGQLTTLEHSPQGWTVKVVVPETAADLPKTMSDALLLMSELGDVDAPFRQVTVEYHTNKFKDVYGRQLQDVPTVRIDLAGDTFAKIEWDGFDQKNFPRVADEFWLHELMQQQSMTPLEEQGTGGSSNGGGGGGGGGEGGGGGGGGGGSGGP